MRKTFELLEFVASRQGEPVTPMAAAAATGIHIVTCTRILGELVELGYIEKISRKTGYAPGPMIASLANRDNAYTRLSRAAEHHVKALAAELGMPVNLAVMKDDDRIMLYFSGPADRKWRPWPSYRFRDHADTATGRLLLATLPRERAEQILLHHPARTAILAELPEIRVRGFVEFMAESEGVLVQGHLILSAGYPPAAIGFGLLPGTDPAKTLAKSGRVARLIADELAADIRAY